MLCNDDKRVVMDAHVVIVYIALINNSSIDKKGMI